MRLPRVCSAVLVCLGLLACGGICRAQESARPPDPQGDWEGTLKLPVGELRLVIHLKAGPDGSLTGTFDSPDQGAAGALLDPVTLEGRTLRFVHPKARGRFEGQFNEAGTEIQGTWTQRGSLPLSLRRLDPARAQAMKVTAPEELKGLWSGALQLPGGIELALVLNVAPDADGTLVPRLDSPDQNVQGIPVTALELKDGTLSFASKAVGAKFDGKRSADGNAFEGTFTQGLVRSKLTLTRQDRAPERRRPQTPKPPFPYDTEEVAFANPDARGVTLAGTLTRPKGDGPFPVVVFISGSGPQDRDETLLGHKPFAVLADALTRRGIACLRYDDRGTAGSTGDHDAATSRDFASDVRAAIAFLKDQPRIDPKRIGLIGHSEGGLIAPMVAADSPDVAYVVLLAGTGVPGDQILYRQNALIARAMGAGELAVQAQVAALKLSLAVVRGQADAAQPEADRQAPGTAAGKGETTGKPRAGDNPLGQALAQLKTPWFRFFVDHDPRPTLARVGCPVLVLNGSKDRQVDPEQNVPEIEKALRAGGNTKVTTRVFPDLNHLFQTCTTGAPSEYNKIEETIAAVVLQTVADWIVEQTRID